MRSLVIALAALLASPAYAQEKAVPVEEEPSHKTVLKNDYIQVFRVRIEPGQASQMHIHAHDDAAVRLSKATVVSESPDRPVGAPESASPGVVSAREIEGKPLTHRVRNVGTTAFEVMDVQILKRPDGPAAPPIAATAAENPQMRIYRYELEPGGKSAQHAHARPYLLVAATDMNLRMTSPDGRSMSHPIRAGDFHWIEAVVTHTFHNDGKEKGVLVEIELK